MSDNIDIVFLNEMNRESSHDEEEEEIVRG